MVLLSTAPRVQVESKFRVDLNNETAVETARRLIGKGELQENNREVFTDQLTNIINRVSI